MTIFNFLYTYVGLVPIIVPKSSSTVLGNYLSDTTERQQNIFVELQPSNLISIVSNTHATTTPITTFSIVECLTTRSSVVTSISGQQVSPITTAGVYES